MKPLTPFVLAALTVFCGCAHRGEVGFTHGTGEAGLFILQQAIARGAQPITTNDLPVIAVSWRYSEDSYGVTLRLSRRDYQGVEALLRQAFGPLQFEPTTTSDGGTEPVPLPCCQTAGPDHSTQQGQNGQILGTARGPFARQDTVQWKHVKTKPTRHLDPQRPSVLLIKRSQTIRRIDEVDFGLIWQHGHRGG